MIGAQKPRAVSGDFMAGSADAGAAGRGHDVDVIDADYISLPGGACSATQTSSAVHGRAAIGSATAPTAGMDVLRREATAPACFGRRRGGSFSRIVVAGVILVSFWVSGGHALLRHVSQGGVEIPDSAFRISTVDSRIDTSGIRPLLFVDGEAVNEGSMPESLSALEIAVIGNDGVLTRYRLGTSVRLLSPGETFAFSSRLDAPKNGVRTVSVTFRE